MSKIAKYLVAASLVVATAPVAAATINVDLSGASGGSTITGIGASFTQSFTGQTVVGTGVTGAPTGPLSLSASGSITVAFWSPGVSAGSNSLLSQPNNGAPLAMLLDGNTANSITFTAGSWGGGSVDVLGFAADGSLTGSTTISGSDYQVFTVSGIGNFAGILFTNNSDPSGLRFQNRPAGR